MPTPKQLANLKPGVGRPPTDRNREIFEILSKKADRYRSAFLLSARSHPF
ncbi:MAG: hypothetical protein ACRCZS_16270 [Chroococcidiopsis sp.]